MKLNRMMIAATALVAGSLSVMACSKADDAVSTEPASMAQASVTEQSTQAAAEGTEEYARWGHHYRGPRAEHWGARRRGDDRGWFGRRWGWRRDHDRDDRRVWWRRFW
jgi:hypothetical protein